METISLRGLGDQRTKVLLNGRVAGPAGVRGGVAAFDLNVIPVEAIAQIDILKTGGYKVSALEIEAVLLEHARVRECAVVALPDAEWGERVAAALVLKKGELTLPALRDWARPRLAPYKLPTRLLLVEALPRNAMGKVLKPDVVRLFEAAS